jgi:hypothetical protein
MASISERENRDIEAARASGNTPVVFIHGLWLLPSSGAHWADFFKQAGHAPGQSSAATYELREGWRVRTSGSRGGTHRFPVLRPRC